MDAASAKEAKKEGTPVEYIANYIGDQSLGEMGDQDQDNFNYIMQHKTYIRRFRKFDEQESLRLAMDYIFHVVDTILRRHGFKMTPAMAKNPKIVDVVLEKQFRLRIETRHYPPEETVYQTGIYILKLRRAGGGDLIDHEIVGFVSQPYKDQDPDSKIVYFNPEVCVRSTERL